MKVLLDLSHNTGIQLSLQKHCKNIPHTAPVVLPTKDVDAGTYSSDEDFEKENILIDQQVKKATTKSKKSKVKKDPGAPKRPASSYTLFCKQV